MFLYENDICPVCGKRFESGDDVVTCADCATPHHRECYNKLGHCKNQDLHGTDFVYKRGAVGAFERIDETEREEYYIPPQTAEENTQVKTQEDAQEKAIPPIGDAAQDGAIDGVKLQDIIAVVAVNTQNFVRKFKRNRRLGWNWSALIFGPYYFFFRKMYLQGSVILAVECALRLMISAIYAPAIGAVSAFIAKENPTTYAKTFEAMLKAAELPEYAQVAAASMLILASIIIIHLVCALFADSFYRRKVINIVKTVDDRIKAGGEFSVNPIMVTDGNMSHSQMRRLFLSRRGGVSTFSPLLAILLVQIFLNFIQVF